MRSISNTLITLLLLLTALIHLLIAPFTKVEESFNIQAIHDILHYGVPLQNISEKLNAHFDHVTFPGAVPRTFVGAVIVAQVTGLFGRWAEGVVGQVIARGILGLFNIAALISYQDAITQAFGTTAGNWYILLQASQFHVMYYLSRTLPNMFAFGITTFALRLLLLSNFGPLPRRRSRTRLALYLLTLAGVIFRSELAILILTATAWILVRPHLYRSNPTTPSTTTTTTSTIISTSTHLLRTTIIPPGLAGLLCGLLITIPIDTLLWHSLPLTQFYKQPIWPELSALLFNTVEGHASDWGVSPWHHYFSSAIPKLLLNPLVLVVCIPLALISPATRGLSVDVLVPLLGFVGVYSILPHKEWRFILYIIPGLTGIAAAGASWIWTRRGKTLVYRILSLALAGSVLASSMASLVILAISSANYPGAEALVELHQRFDLDPSLGMAGQGHGDGNRTLVKVHLSNLACQTGVTRFVQKSEVSGVGPRHEGVHTMWYYDKSDDEQLLSTPEFWEAFDYVILEDPVVNGEWIIPGGIWDVVDRIYGYAGIGFRFPGRHGQAGVEVGRSFFEVLVGRLHGNGNSNRGEGGVSDALARVVDAGLAVEKWMAWRVMGGRWPVVVMRPRLIILRRRLGDPGNGVAS